MELPDAAAAKAAVEQQSRVSKALVVVPALYSSRVKTVDDAFQVRSGMLLAASAGRCHATSRMHCDWCAVQRAVVCLLSRLWVVLLRYLSCAARGCDSINCMQEYFYGIGMAEPVATRVQQVKATPGLALGGVNRKAHCKNR